MYASFIKTAVVVAVVAIATPATASFHLMKIREVFAGSTADPDAQYVVLQMFSAGQSQVGGHSVTVFDGHGANVGTFTFAGAVADGSNQATILVATAEAETMFGVAADLAMLPVLDPVAGKVCFDSADCVAWGDFEGNSASPSPSGTPYGPNGGISPGHAIARDTSRGNAAILDSADDTNDSFADFLCVATATPRNNAGDTGTYTDPDPCPVCGNDLVEVGEMCDGTDDAACVGGCQVNCLCPRHDSLVAPIKPISLKVPDRNPFAIVKKVNLRVMNVDTDGSTNLIKLTADLGNCPPGVSVSQPDFAPPSSVDTVSLAGGKSAKAIAFITVDSTAFTTFNVKTPNRCTLEFTSSTEVVGNTDPVPSNNTAILELNVIDRNDPGTASPPDHESFIVSLKPTKVSIGKRKDIAFKKVAPAVGNGDILPEPDVGDVISVSVDTSACTGVTATVDMDKKTPDNQDSIAVNGGRSVKGAVLITADAHDISTPNRKSPERCFATVTATGPSNPDPEPSNNVSTLVIDIFDKNDF